MYFLWFTKNNNMALFKATITKSERLADGSLIEKGMSLQYSYFGIPWDGNGPGVEAINNAFFESLWNRFKEKLCIKSRVC